MSKLLIRVDGSCMPNPGNMAIGVVIYRDGQLWKKINEIVGFGTNNIAEYRAVIRGLEEIKDTEADLIEFYCDSQLIVKQLNKQFKVKNEKMIPLFEHIQELLKEIKTPVYFIWNRREENKLADQLARKLLIKEEQNKRAIASQELVVEKNGNKWTVSNEKNKKVYHVDLTIPECDCYDFENNCQKWNLECKHILAVRNHIKEKTIKLNKKEELVLHEKSFKVLILSKMVTVEKWKEYLDKYNQEDLLPLELVFPGKDNEQLSDILSTAQVIIGGQLDELELKQARMLKLFQIPFTGVDKQNLKNFKNYPHIAVCNTHGNSHGVSELALGLLLALAKNIINNDKDLRIGIWHSIASGKPTIQLHGRKLGIIGLGSIGKEIARRALSFGMEIYALKRTTQKIEEIKKTFDLNFLGTLKDLEYVVKESDFIIISLPLTTKTENLFDEKILKSMKGKFLINIGRGKIVNEKSLYHYLKDGTIAGAGIDTWYQYPDKESPEKLPSNYAFHELPNIIMSPHNAGYTDKAIEENILQVYKNIKRVYNGEEPENRISLDEGY